MKKTVLSILAICFVLIGVLSFSCPVEASQRIVYNKVTRDNEYTVTSTRPSISLYYKAGNASGIQSQISGTLGFSLSFPDDAFFDSSMDFYNFDQFALRGLFNISASLNHTSTSEIAYSSINIRNAYFVVGGHRYLLRCMSTNSSNGQYLLNIADNYFSPTFAGTQCFIQLECDFVASVAFSGTAEELNDFFVAFFKPSASASTCYKQTWSDSYTWKLIDNQYVSSTDITNQTTQINNNITQQTQQQTESLQNGYDNSSMSQDNTRLNDQISQYDQAQESATNTSVSNIDAAEFINPSSNTSVFAAMTFSASFLQSLYNNLGDFGIIVMVSLSLCLGLMLVGWFKYRKGG